MPTDQSASAAPEAVRLVVWDLDETFWRGTLTEGGITEYVQAHHDIIIALARRGILSSICSKNSPEPVLEILREKGILDYIVFPSISWEPKGMRLAALVEAVQLRAPTVLFIDDNPNNLAEAQAVVPGIQVENEHFIARMLEDPRFKGKHDADLTRLAQYKLLEARHRDETQAGGDNHAFLRGCDVRVHIEYDVMAHIDRAIELINRTNQLNYTKQRLPEDLTEARAQLGAELKKANHQAGLVRVVDKYGDYGFVGFFLMKNQRPDPQPGLATQTLLHYCFSCRTLGMLVEYWLYDHLRRPHLRSVGEVLTDLTQPRTVDWIRQVDSIADDAPARPSIAPEIRVLGGCEANAVAHYLAAHSPEVKVVGNFAAAPMFVRVNSSALLLAAMDHAGPALTQEMASLGIAAPLLGTDYFRGAPDGTVFVFSGAMDAAPAHQRFRHRTQGWEINLALNGNPLNFVTAPEAEIAALIARFPLKRRQHAAFTIRQIRTQYEPVENAMGGALIAQMQALLNRVPAGGKFVILLDDVRVRSKEGALRHAPLMQRYNDQMQALAAQYPFVTVASFADFIQSEDEIQSGGNHYDRMVYWRLAERIVELVSQLPGKQQAATKAA